MGSKNSVRSQLSIGLEDGIAHVVGDGMVVVIQHDRDAAVGRRMQSVVLSSGDLQMLRDASGTSLMFLIQGGEAHHMGDGLFVVLQRDLERPGRPMQNVVVSANDAAAMLTAA